MCLDIKKIWKFSYIFVEGIFFFTQPGVLHLLDIFQPRPFLRKKLSLTLSQNGLKGPILPLLVCAQTLSPVQGVLMQNGLILLFLLLLKGLFYTFCKRNIIVLYNEIQRVFGSNLKSQLIFLFSLFLLLFMSLTALFGTIHKSHCTISNNFYLYLQYFQQKIFIFSKISESQTDPYSIK